MTKFSSNIIHINSECPINDEYFWIDAKYTIFLLFEHMVYWNPFKNREIYFNMYF